MTPVSRMGQCNKRFIQTDAETFAVILKKAILCFKNYQYKRECSPTKRINLFFVQELYGMHIILISLFMLQ
jgi:hypothetical protein